MEILDSSPLFQVELVSEPGNEQPYILKKVSSGEKNSRASQILKNEYKICSEFNVQGIRRAKDLHEDNGGLEVALDFVEGQTLRAYAKTEAKGPEEVLPIFLSLLSIIHELHEAGIIHRNLNSDNVIIGKKREVTLIGLGLCARCNQLSPLQYNLDELEGNIHFISPEQTARINRKIDYRTDFYSVGVMLYEALTGKIPFESPDPLEVIHGHIARKVEFPEDADVEVPGALKQIIRKLLEKNPENRYRSVSGILHDLEECNSQLQRSGLIKDFKLGEVDFSSTLTIPEKLYGRENDLLRLLGVFEEVRKGSNELLLISGHPGVGKTSLVKEFKSKIFGQYGYFITGKFDQINRNTPYKALIDAFKELFNFIIAEPPGRLLEWRQRITKALGTSGKLITDTFPTLELIIGKQPELPKLEGESSKNRYKYIFSLFVKSICSFNKPIILFIDDLQWSDAESLELIKTLTLDFEAKNLLIISAFRNNEIKKAGNVRLIIDDIKNEGGKVTSIDLSNLDDSHLTSLISETINPSRESTRNEVIELLHQNTEGNPFFVKEYLMHLHNHKLLYLDRDKSGAASQTLWKIDREKIKSTGLSSNMIDILKSNATKLPERTLQLLKIGSAIGGTFSFNILSFITRHSAADINKHLDVAVQKSLILNVGKDNLNTSESAQVGGDTHYKFIHDWVQQAIYSLIPERDKKSFHYEIGEILLKKFNADETSCNIFDVVHHLNIGAEKTDDPGKMMELTRINLKAALISKESAAFHQSFDFLKAGISYSGDIILEEDYKLGIQLFSEGADAAYLVGEFNLMIEWIKIVLDRSKDILDSEKAYLTLINYYNAINQSDKTIETGLEVLGKLQIGIPVSPSKTRILYNFLYIRWKLMQTHDKKIVGLKPMTDPYKLFALRILSAIGSAAYMTNPELAVLLSFKYVELNLRYGNTNLSAYNFASYGMILCGFTEEIRKGYQFGQIGLKLGQKFEDKTVESRTGVVIYGFLTPWVEPLRAALDPLTKAHISGLESGDLEYATNALGMRNYYAYFSGFKLRELDKEISDYLKIIKNLKQEISIHWHQILLQSIRNLRGKSEDPMVLKSALYDEEEMMEVHENTGNKAVLFTFNINKAILSLLFNDHRKAIEYIEKIGDYLSGLAGSYFIPIYHFYRALVYSSAMMSSTISGRDKLSIIEKSCSKLRKWAKISPSNFSNKFELIRAQLLVLRDRFEDSLSYYESSVEHAEENGFLQEKALAQECAARATFYKDRKNLCRYFLNDALHSYADWGADAKVQQLRNEFSTCIAGDPLFTNPASNAEANTAHLKRKESRLDLASILKASMALARQKDLKGVVEKILNIILENAGAERALLIQNLSGKLLVKAKVIAEDGTYEYYEDATAGNENEFAQSIVYYTARTGRNVLLPNAAESEQFRQDPYIASNKPKSILCAKIGKKGNIQAIVYLENNLSEGAFVPERLRLLNLLSGQASISMENAQLYERLEFNINKQDKLIKAYERFVPREFLGSLGYESILDVSLGDQVVQNVSVFFLDIRSYTTISERLTPAKNFEFLNQFFREIRPNVEQNHGFVTSFYGDGFMALFSTKPDNALDAARYIHKSLGDFSYAVSKNESVSPKVGIGIHTGSLMLGILGDETRMNPGVVSDTVNTASRLEGLTKIFGASTIISEDTYKQVMDSSAYTFRFLGKVNVVGKKEPISVYELFDGVTKDIDTSMIRVFEDGLSKYLNKEFAEAIVDFNRFLKAYPEDKAAKRYLKKSTELLITPPPDDWNGSEILFQK